MRYGLRETGVKTLDDMYAATRAAGFGAEVKRRIMIGTYVLSAGYLRRLFHQGAEGADADQARFRRGVRQVRPHPDPDRAVGGVRAGREDGDPLAMYLNDVFAVPASLAGLPAMSVPGGLDGQGLPLGLHLIGRELDEQGVLNAALAIEERAGFTARAEKWW